MASHEILGGLVQVYKRGGKAWHCSTSLKGRQYRASTKEEGLAALRRGEVQGVANIGIILLGLSRKLEPNRSVFLLPCTAPLGNGTMACVLPQDIANGGISSMPRSSG